MSNLHSSYTAERGSVLHSKDSSPCESTLGKSNSMPKQSATEINAAIERAVNGEYELGIRATLAEAWQCTKGVKRYLLGAWLLLGLAVVGTMEALNLFGLGTGALLPPPGTIPPAQFIFARLAVDMIATALIMPFMGGFIMMALKQIKGEPVDFKVLFNHTDKTIPLFIAALMITVATVIGFAFLIIPGIYLSIAYLCVFALVLDKNISPWQAMTLSRKAVSKNWFKIAVITMVVTLFFVLSALPVGLGLIFSLPMIAALPLGIGLIWSLPFMIVIFNVIYKNIFGISS